MFRNQILLLLLLGILGSCSSKNTEKIPVKVLIINFFEIGDDIGDNPGERQFWVERLKLNQKFDFPQGERLLYYNNKTQILNMVTNQANVNATASMMALGLDTRFDLSQAYILMVGIAGGDPLRTTLGSAVWSRYIVDGDLKHSIDPREIPSGWKDGSYGYLNSKPNETPINYLGTEFFTINEKLLQWAYKLTQNLKLPEDNAIIKKRASYTNFPEAIQSPSVQIGDNITASEYWHGKYKTEWARDWVLYLTQGKGVFYTTAMEDTGVMAAIAKLDRSQLVNKDRVLSLRTISNFSMPANNTISAYNNLIGDSNGYSAMSMALESGFLVGNTVIQEILTHWDKYSNQ